MASGNTAPHISAWTAFDQRFDEHIASLQEFVRIPSTRGEELQAQQWIARRMRALGLSVDLVDCDPTDLRQYAGWAPTNWSYDQAGRLLEQSFTPASWDTAAAAQKTT